MVDMYQQGMYGPEGFYDQALTPATPERGLWGFMAAIPGGPTMMSVNAGRMSRTMLYGARSTRMGMGGPTDGRTYMQNAVRNNNFLNPRTWGRYSTDAFMTTGRAPQVSPGFTRRTMRRAGNELSGILPNPSGKPRVRITNPGATTDGYNPLILSRMANASAGWLGKKMNPEAGGMRGRFAAASQADDVTLFQSGFTGRVGAAARLNNMSAARFGRMQAHGSTFMGSAVSGNAARASTGQAAASRIMMSTTGYYTGRAAGFMQGAVMDKKGLLSESAINRLKGASSTSDEAARGLQMAADWSRKANQEIAEKGTKALLGKAGLRKAGLVGGRVAFGASKVLGGPVGWALLAYDVATIGAKATYAVGSMYSEAYKGATAGMTTRIGGGGFADTQASATSRARGVAAIQNSRLNARSMLGNEAAMMAGAF